VADLNVNSNKIIVTLHEDKSKLYSPTSPYSYGCRVGYNGASKLTVSVPVVTLCGKGFSSQEKF
jgi:hypothetical protein